VKLTGYHGIDNRAVAWDIRTAFSGVREQLDANGDVIKFVVELMKCLREARLDKQVSQFGAVAVAPMLIPIICNEGRCGEYFVTRRKRRATGFVEYCFSEDLTNRVYANWLCHFAGERVEEIERLIGSKAEVWADQVESVLGLCILAERVPVLNDLVKGQLSLLRTRIELSVRSAELSNCPLSHQP
jgi:hypothetical protein